MEYIYKIKELNFQYAQRKNYSLKNINLNIQKGDFVLLIGLSGSGKSTLLKHLKNVLMPNGNRRGEILFENIPLESIDTKEQASKIGYVTQNPDNQIVTDKVWHELAFGLESLGMNSDEIKLRVSEMASFFGIQNWFHKDVEELSGGQKQLLNLASIMAMQPSVLILDEPTSQLDPIASNKFLDVLKKINDELGVTIILSEQRFDDALSFCNHIILMNEGNIILDERNIPAVTKQIKLLNHPIFEALPTPAILHSILTDEDSSPLTIKDGKKWFSTFCKNRDLKNVTKSLFTEKKECILKIDDLWFKYETAKQNTIKGLSLEIFKGEIFSILGGNGTGKSTLLSLITGINSHQYGKIFINGKNNDDITIKERFTNLIAFLPQNPQTLFVKKTVLEELKDGIRKSKDSSNIKNIKLNRIIELCNLQDLLISHPYDLSGGEQQRVALAKILLLEPKILLLDEATKGIDVHFKNQLAEILQELKKLDITIIMVSHDIEFCAKYSDRCAMFFDGNIVSINNPIDFFSGNRYYTTNANKIAKDILPKAITIKDILSALNYKNYTACLENDNLDTYNKQKKSDNTEPVLKNKFFLNNNSKLNMTENQSVVIYEDSENIFLNENYNEEEKNNRTSRKKFSFRNIRIPYLLTKIILLIATFYLFFNKFDEPYNYILNAVIGLEILLILGELFPSEEINLPDYTIQEPYKKRKLHKSTIIASIIILFLIPFTIYFGIYYLNDRKYFLISLFIILESMIPFILIFEDRKPQARELVTIAVLIAIAVSGRSAFFMLQNFKPIAAIVIISGVCLGAEVGFLTGASSMLVSNMFFGQGPWTPWQMFATGLIGFLAGILFKKGLIRKQKLSLCIFGALSVFFIYGGIMNPASVLMFQNKPTKEMFILAYLRGIPFDIIYASATIFFMYFAAKPMIEKIERIKIKYGIFKN